MGNLNHRELGFQLIWSGTAQTGSLRTWSICRSDKKISEKQFTRRVPVLTVDWDAKKEREENETSVNVGQSLAAMARRGEKVARKNGGAAKRINAVVMHEEDGKRWYTRHQTRWRRNANSSREGSQERTRWGRWEEARSRTISIEGELSEGMKVIRWTEHREMRRWGEHAGEGSPERRVNRVWEAVKWRNVVVTHKEQMIWPASNATTVKCQSQQENEVGYRGNWGEQRVGEHWWEDERGDGNEKGAIKIMMRKWGEKFNNIVSSAHKERWASGTHEDTERRYEDCPRDAVREIAPSLFLQNSTLSNTWRCCPGPLIAVPDYDRDRQEPPHWAGRESQKAHTLGIEETTFRSFRPSGSMSWRILTLCWIAAFNSSTLVLIEMLSIEYGFRPPSRKNQRSLDVCRDIVGDSRYWKISISNKRVNVWRLEFTHRRDQASWAEARIESIVNISIIMTSHKSKSIWLPYRMFSEFQFFSLI